GRKLIYLERKGNMHFIVADKIEQPHHSLRGGKAGRQHLHKDEDAQHKRQKHSAAAYNSCSRFRQRPSSKAIDQEAGKRQQRNQPGQLYNITHKPILLNQFFNLFKKLTSTECILRYIITIIASPTL